MSVFILVTVNSPMFLFQRVFCFSLYLTVVCFNSEANSLPESEVSLTRNPQCRYSCIPSIVVVKLLIWFSYFVCCCTDNLSAADSFSGTPWFYIKYVIEFESSPFELLFSVSGCTLLCGVRSECCILCCIYNAICEHSTFGNSIWESYVNHSYHFCSFAL